MNPLQKLPHDKALHLIGGVMIFAVFNFFVNWQVGLAMSAGIGALKEYWDYQSKKGTPDLWDFVATFAGGILGFLCTLKVIL